GIMTLLDVPFATWMAAWMRSVSLPLNWLGLGISAVEPNATPARMHPSSKDANRIRFATFPFILIVTFILRKIWIKIPFAERNRKKYFIFSYFIETNLITLPLIYISGHDFHHGARPYQIKPPMSLKAQFNTPFLLNGLA